MGRGFQREEDRTEAYLAAVVTGWRSAFFLDNSETCFNLALQTCLIKF
jgi:hypothetical protein